MKNLFKGLLKINNVDNWHESMIKHLIILLKPKSYLELGLYQCELFNKLIPYCNSLVGVDIVEKSGNFMKKSNKVSFMNMTTDAYYLLAKSKNLKFDFIFIDADHSKESVYNDFNNYINLLSDQGIMCLHDSYPKNKLFTEPGYCGDGYKAIFELSKNTEDYEMVTIPIHPGLTIVRKREKQINWIE